MFTSAEAFIARDDTLGKTGVDFQISGASVCLQIEREHEQFHFIRCTALLFPDIGHIYQAVERNAKLSMLDADVVLSWFSVGILLSFAMRAIRGFFAVFPEFSRYHVQRRHIPKRYLAFSAVSDLERSGLRPDEFNVILHPDHP